MIAAAREAGLSLEEIGELSRLRGLLQAEHGRGARRRRVSP